MCFYSRFICLCIYLFISSLVEFQLCTVCFDASVARPRGWAGLVAMVTPKPKVVIYLQAVCLSVALGC